MTETTLTAKPALLVVTPGSSETTFITYSKDQDENIFERTWTIAAAAAPDWSPHVGSVDEGPEHGEYKKTLKSGMKYEVGVFQKGGGPGSSEPRQHADLIVYCISNTREMGLITDENHDRGGTWASLRVIAHDCEVVAAGASRTTPSLAGAGFPRLTAPEGNVTANITVQGGGIVAIDLMCSPLLPGNPYFFVV
ncbi:hypothetical protein, partial [Streptomyces sp.]|uniref:hypothetical protein n=1 Tax=Streptomyces sp. TaxID=1931 RepID=UPI0025F31C5F